MCPICIFASTVNSRRLCTRSSPQSVLGPQENQIVILGPLIAHLSVRVGSAELPNRRGAPLGCGVALFCPILCVGKQYRAIISALPVSRQAAYERMRLSSPNRTAHLMSSVELLHGKAKLLLTFDNILVVLWET